MNSGKGRRVNHIWKYFTKAEDRNSARCGVCLNILSIRGGSTSNLNRHMKMRHPSIEVEPRFSFKSKRPDRSSDKSIKEENDDQCNKPTKNVVPKKLHEMTFVLPLPRSQRNTKSNDSLESNDNNIIIQEIVHSDDAEFEIREEESESTNVVELELNSGDNKRLENKNPHVSKKPKTTKSLKHVMQNDQLRRENSQLRKMNREAEKSKDFPVLDHFDPLDLFFLSMSRMTKKLSKVEQSNIKLLVSEAVLKAELRYEESLQNSATIRIINTSTENDTRPTLLEMMDLDNNC